MDDVALWNPTVILDVEDMILSSSTTPWIVNTDAGKAVYKSPYNPLGPHTLVCEYVGTCLAKMIGLPLYCSVKSLCLRDSARFPMFGR
jgi:hypothetical protein